jgi:hypothetical protein
MGIHIIDIVQPPGIGIPPIADMDAHQTIVSVALAAKSSAETAKKARWETRSQTIGRETFSPAVAPRQPRLGSALVILVVAGHQIPVSLRPLGARSSHWNMPQRTSSPRIGRISVVNDTVFERERAHPGCLTRICRRIGPDRGRHLGDRTLAEAREALRERCGVAPVVVFDAPLALY